MILVCLMANTNTFFCASDSMRLLLFKSYNYRMDCKRSTRRLLCVPLITCMCAVELMQNEPFDSLKQRFLTKSRYQPAIQTWTPGLLKEVQGVADGAGIDFNTMYLFQIIEDLDNYIGYTRHQCTALGVHQTDTQPTLLAQNMDPPNFLHGFPTIFHHYSFHGIAGVCVYGPRTFRT